MTRVLVAGLLVSALVAPVSGDQRQLRRLRIADPSGSVAGCDGNLLDQHPRIVYNACTASDVLSKISTGGRYNTLYQAQVDELHANWDTIDASGCDSTGTCGTYAMNAAFWYLTYDGVTGINHRGRSKANVLAKAIAIMDYARVSAYPSGVPNYGGFRFAYAYDWLYNALTGTQRSNIVSWLADAQYGSACPEYPLVSQGLNNSQIAGCWATMIAAAVAAKGDGYETTWVDAQYANYDEMMRNQTGFLGFEALFLGQTGGDGSEGFSYFYGYTSENIWPAEEAWRTAHNYSKSAHYNVASADALHYWHRLILSQWLPWQEGGSVKVAYSGFRTAPRELLTRYSARLPIQWLQWSYDGVDSDAVASARWVQQNITGELDTSGAECLRYCLIYILMGPASAPTAASPTTQGLAAHYRAGTSRYVLREDWDPANTDGGWVSIEAQKWSRGSDIRPRNPGGVTLIRDGYAPIGSSDDGPNGTIYQNWPGAGSGMVFPDRSINSPATYGTNTQGAIRRMNSALTSAADFTNGSNYDILGTVRDSLASGSVVMSYVGMDLCRSYDCSAGVSDSPTNADRISAYWKDVIAFTLSDRVVAIEQDRTTTTSTDYVQTDLVHLPVAPSLDGSDTPLARVPDAPCPTSSVTAGVDVECPTMGDTQGHTTYSGTTLITATDTRNSASGKEWITPLLPASRTVTVVGGPDADGNSFNTAGGNYSIECTDLYGIRYPCNSFTFSMARQYVSQYRIEITNATPTTTDTFLKVRELTASGGSQGTTKLYTNGAGGNDFNCVRVGSYVGCLGEDGASKTGGDAIFEDAGTFTVKWCNLNPSAARTFAKGSNITSITDIGPSGAGTDTDLTYTADSAGCLNLSIVVGSGGTSNNTITVS